MNSFFLDKLPDHVSAGGKFFPIKTDFRIWLAFAQTIEQKDAILDDVSFV